ncbi:MAG: ribonuclease III [Gammaproteobacteria bacterium]|nr:ribonuclease III [Gammaproteobacteria bacterium]
MSRQREKHTLDVLQQRLGHTFGKPEMLRQAVTHRSAGVDNWERLEFLGDAVLGFVVSRALFDLNPEVSEQQLTVMRANLVQKDALADVAADLGLSAFLNLGTVEDKSGVAEHTAIRADALEAVLGAVACDGGIDAASKVVERLYGDRLTDPAGIGKKDPKSRLQEILQAKRLELPTYTVVATTGEEHARVYHVECAAEGLSARGEASGRSLREAEKRAAAAVLAILAPRPDDDD